MWVMNLSSDSSVMPVADLMTNKPLQEVLYMVLVAGNFLNSVCSPTVVKLSVSFRCNFMASTNWKPEHRNPHKIIFSFLKLLSFDEIQDDEVGKTCTMQEDDQESTQHFRDQT
jgi:hypothetical protein